MTLEEKVYSKLLEKGYKVATAESFTGGMLAARIINVNGASNNIDMSFVTYADRAKVELVNVKQETIDKYTVVSEEVAKEMAVGAKEKASSQIGLSTTGLAGPSGDGIHEVGTVCFGIAINDKVYTYTEIYKNKPRDYIRSKGVEFILNKLLEILN
jgi:PncC family amidohydrolase